MDVVGGVLLADGTECKVLTGVDDHSRFCVCAGVMVRATTRPICGFFAQALARHGVPEQVLTDNGKVFTNRFALKPTEVLFDNICRENGITHRLTAPASPARSSGSTGLFARSSCPDASLRRCPRCRHSSMPGSTTTTPTAPTGASRCRPRPNASPCGPRPPSRHRPST